VVRLSTLGTGSSFVLQAESTPGPWCGRNVYMSLKHSNNTIGNRTRGLPGYSAVPQPTLPPLTPRPWCKFINMFNYVTVNNCFEVALPYFIHWKQSTVSQSNKFYKQKILNSSLNFVGMEIRKVNWIGNLLRKNCLLKHITEVNTEGRIGVTERRRRRRKQLIDDFKQTRGYCKLKMEALDRTLWRIRFGSGYGPVVRQTAG